MQLDLERLSHMGFNTCRIGFLAVTVAVSALLVASEAQAQDQRWVQVEAHRDLDVALERARLIESRLGNVSGFRLPSNWYALSLGPFDTETDAFLVRMQLRSEAAIPADAFVSDGTDYLEQVFPEPGAEATQVIPDAAQQIVDVPDQVAEPEVAPVPEPEETLREAQASEQLLDRDARAALQTALQWFGFYDLAIDASFGPGTRRSMGAWQLEQGYETTGVLTTRQRAELLEAYSSEIAELGMETVRDDRAGISIDLPLAMVSFDRYETPFVHFNPRNDSGVQVLLISQSGTQATLFGLYEMMQTLEIVPLEGLRERRQNSFILTGQNETLRSHTFAQFRNGEIKGYTLVWTPERDAQMERVLSMMEASFNPLSGTLPDSAGQASAVSRSDLLAGLAVRRPDFSRSGFFIDASGRVLTTAEVVSQCERITIDEAHGARVVARDDVLGLAVLEPETPLAPLAYAQFLELASPLGSEITVAGFPFEDVMARPVLTFGRVEALEGLNGEQDRLRLSADLRAGDRGGPVFGANGGVIGLLMGPLADGTRLLPEDVNFAINAEAIRRFLDDGAISSGNFDADASVPPEMLTRIAGDLTVLVSCWN